jgi:hypothetical protein
LPTTVEAYKDSINKLPKIRAGWIKQAIEIKAIKSIKGKIRKVSLPFLASLKILCIVSKHVSATAVCSHFKTALRKKKNFPRGSCHLHASFPFFHFPASAGSITHQSNGEFYDWFRDYFFITDHLFRDCFEKSLQAIMAEDHRESIQYLLSLLPGNGFCSSNWSCNIRRIALEKFLQLFQFTVS